MPRNVTGTLVVGVTPGRLPSYPATSVFLQNADNNDRVILMGDADGQQIRLPVSGTTTWPVDNSNELTFKVGSGTANLNYAITKA